MYHPGIEGQCPKCMAQLVRRPGGWRGLVDMTALAGDEGDYEVYYCLMCSYYEDAVMQANRLAQHQQVSSEVPA